MGCILCGGAEFSRVYVIAGHSIERCTQCGLTQLHPLPDAKTIAALYDDGYYSGGGPGGYSEYQAREEEYAATFRADLRRIAGFFPAGRALRILDVGCGPGIFLGVGLAAGHDVYGVDIIPSVVDEARRRYSGRAFVGPAEDVPELRGLKFDVVFASHVIEHITDPLAFTRGLRGFLSDGGLLVYVTPNIQSVLARISGRRWVSFKLPEHVAYYDRETLFALARKADLDPIAADSAYEYHGLPFIVSRVRKLIRPLDRLVPPFETLTPLRDRIVRVTSGSIRLIARAGSAPS